MPLFRRGRDQQPATPVRSAAALERSALARLRAGDYAQAVQDLRQIISLDPNADWAYAELATAYQQQGQPEAALAAIELAIQRSPVDAALRRAHGQILESLNRLTEAADAYNAAAGLDPDDTLTLVALSGLALKLHDPRAAERCLEAALSRAPSDERLLVGLADLREQQGLLEGALDVLRRAAALNARSPVYHHRMGALLERMGDLDAALAAYRVACDLAPSNVAYVAAMQNLIARREHEAALRATPVTPPLPHTPPSNLRRVQVKGVPPRSPEPEVVEPPPEPESRPSGDSAPPEAMRVPAPAPPVPAVPVAPDVQRAPDRPETAPTPAASPAAAASRTSPAPARPRTIKEYEAAVAADPGNARLHHELSIQYLRAGRIADAKRHAQLAEQARSRRAGS